MSNNIAIISDTEDDEYGITALAIHYSDDDDDIISYESLQYQKGLKEHFKTICENNVGNRPTTPEIKKLAIDNGGRITMYESTQSLKIDKKEFSFAFSMSDLASKSKDELTELINDMEMRGAYDEIEALWQAVDGDAWWARKMIALKQRRRKVGFCL